MQKFIATGNVNNIEIKMAGSSKILTFQICVQRHDKDKNVDWFSCTTWGKIAELAEKYLKKGRLVLVEGKIKTNRPEKVTYYNIDVEYIEYLDSGKKKQEEE